MSLEIVVAMARNGVIGRDGQLPWRLSEDLKRFKALTLGHAVLMGRKTWESLPEKVRPLPGRHNLIVTRQEDYHALGSVDSPVTVCSSIEEALAKAGKARVFAIGGAEIYAQAWGRAQKLHLTLIDADIEGDTRLHAEDWKKGFQVMNREKYTGPEFGYEFIEAVRRI